MFSLLIVDDFGSQRRIMKMQTGHLGIDYKEANNGKEALGILDKSRVDGIITDIEMPEMDGIQMVKEIRNRPKYRDLPILMISSRDDKREEAERNGISAWLNKPFGKNELIEHMESIFPEISASNKKDIIIIDDNPGDSNILVRLYNQPGHNYRYAETAMEGVRQFQKNPSDLIIKTDLPESSVTGEKFVKKLRSRAQFKKVPILLLSNEDRINKSYGINVETINSQKADINEVKSKINSLVVSGVSQFA